LSGPFTSQAQSRLAAFGTGAGNNHLHYASLLRGGNDLAPVGIKRVVCKVAANVDKFHFFENPVQQCCAL